MQKHYYISQFPQAEEALCSLMMHIIFTWTTVADSDSGTTWQYYKVKNSKTCLWTPCAAFTITFAWAMMYNIRYTVDGTKNCFTIHHNLDSRFFPAEETKRYLIDPRSNCHNCRPIFFPNKVLRHRVNRLNLPWDRIPVRTQIARSPKPSCNTILWAKEIINFGLILNNFRVNVIADLLIYFLMHVL